MACIEIATTCITQGNDWYLDITLTEDGVFLEDGTPVNPVNITGASIALDLKETKEGATVISPTIVIGCLLYTSPSPRDRG